MTNRLDPGMIGEEGRKQEGDKKRIPREHTVKMAGLYRNEKLREGKPMSWRSLG